MRELIFLDTESTGNDVANDRLCQLCYHTSQGTRLEYFKPPVPISVKAMSITHITNDMVADKPPFEGSAMKAELQDLLRDGVLVAHSALFDMAMLKAEGVVVSRFICTLRITRYLDPDNKIPEHNLQFLRYHLNLQVEGAAHDAEGDVNVLRALYTRLFKKIRETEESDEAAVEKMIEISSRPTLFKYFLFGKHKGREVAEVAKTDRSYMEWLLAQKVGNGETLDDDWVYTLKHYLER
jgi:DNA polymerase III epsilon subunit-like protein